MMCIWRSNDWRDNLLGAMSDSHVSNCLAYIRRGGPVGPFNASKFSPREWAMIFATELIRRSRLR
jgi:hypothetical protein